MELLLIGAYLALVGSSYVSGKFVDKAYFSKLKRLGYISTEPELHGDEAKLEHVTDFIKNLLLCATPILNFIPIIVLFAFEACSDSTINSELSEGKLRKVTEEELKQNSEEGYLQKRIEEVRQFQMTMGHKNIPRPYSELSNDERIALLLQELQLAYEKKAIEEGIDLTEAAPILEAMPGNNEPKGLKKELQH